MCNILEFTQNSLVPTPYLLNYSQQCFLSIMDDLRQWNYWREWWSLNDWKCRNVSLTASTRGGHVKHCNLAWIMTFINVRCYTVWGYATVCHLSVSPSICPSATFRYRDYISWNTSKIISRLISLRYMLGLTPPSAIWSSGNTSKIRVE